MGEICLIVGLFITTITLVGLLIKVNDTSKYNKDLWPQDCYVCSSAIQKKGSIKRQQLYGEIEKLDLFYNTAELDSIKETLNTILTQIVQLISIAPFEISKMNDQQYLCNECDKPTKRQVDSYNNCLNAITEKDLKNAYHYLTEYVDNYWQGAQAEINHFELQVIGLFCFILKELE